MNAVIKIHKTVHELLALIFINGLAFVYDSNYIMMALGIDAMVLGVNIRDFEIFKHKENKQGEKEIK